MLLLDKVRDTIEKNKLLEYGDNVICAVSGGADSVCMLHVMLSLREEYNLTVYIANVNHLLRGDEADEDSEFVRAISKAADVKLFYREYDVHKIARERKLGDEECGRELRYEFFRELSVMLGGAKIATAHNLDDNAETVLFRLARGTASHGLGGISYKRDNIIRPLLDASRKEIEKYLKTRSITWREDSTNKLPIYARNKIRLEVMPVLGDISSQAAEKIVSAAKLVSEDDEFLNACANVVMKECFNGEAIEIASFDNAPMPLKRRIAASVLDVWGVKEISAEKIEEFLKFIYKENGKMFDLNTFSYALKDYGKVIKLSREEKVDFEEVLDEKNPVITEYFSVRVFFSEMPVKKAGNDVAVFDAEKLSLPLVVTKRQDGDKMKLKGMAGTKKLSDIFTDAKVDLSERDKIPIVRKDGEIIYVGGLRQTSFYSADENTRKWLVIKYERR